jgi:hypothetical protein
VGAPLGRSALRRVCPESNHERTRARKERLVDLKARSHQMRCLCPIGTGYRRIQADCPGHIYHYLGVNEGGGGCDLFAFCMERGEAKVSTESGGKRWGLGFGQEYWQ